MVPTENAAGKGKRKRVSKQANTSKGQSKKSKMPIVEEDDDEEMLEVKPKWPKNMRLSQLSEVWREELYMEKIARVKNKDNIFVCERAVFIEDFRTLGIADCFERLGWGAALTFHDPIQRDKIPVDAIKQWMATLKKDVGNNPPWTTTLIGKVGEKYVEMSFNTIKQVVDFDTLPDEEYEFPSAESLLDKDFFSEEDKEMLKELFLPGKQETFKKSDMNILPKIVTMITHNNISPKLGAKNELGRSDVRVLSNLVTGRRMLSLRYIVMMNVWESRESSERKMIPHCRLITALMRTQGALTKKMRYLTKTHKYLIMSRFYSTVWEYVKTVTWLSLRDKTTNLKLKGRLPDAPSEQLTEEDAGKDVVVRTNGEIRVEEGDEEEDASSSGSERSSQDRIDGRGTAIRMTFEQFEQVKLMRPKGFSTFSKLAQAMFDQQALYEVKSQARHEEAMALQRKAMEENELFHRNLVYLQQTQQSSSGGSGNVLDFSALSDSLMKRWFSGGQIPSQGDDSHDDPTLNRGGTR